MLAGVIAGALAALLLPGPAAARQAPPTDDPLAGDQVVIAALGLTDAWPTSTGEGVTIAVVDDGVDGEHPDLRGRLAPDADPTATTDPRGTGTHAAGVAAATGDNAEGIVGVAPGAQLLPVAVGADGDRETTGVAGAVTTAAEAGAGVIALTLGGDTGRLADALADDAVDRAVRAADAAGSVVVVADPGATDIGDLPVLLVSATEAPTGTPGGVTAPGRGVLGPAPLGPTTTWPAGTDGYKTLDGLVPATAATAGVAALLVSLGRTPRRSGTSSWPPAGPAGRSTPPPPWPRPGPPGPAVSPSSTRTPRPMAPCPPPPSADWWSGPAPWPSCSHSSSPAGSRRAATAAGPRRAPAGRRGPGLASACGPGHGDRPPPPRST